jgi:uncharacterized protein YjbI with pentapeptide repeats
MDLVGRFVVTRCHLEVKMSTSPLNDSDFDCACEESLRDACYGDPTYQTAEGLGFCVLHCPIKEKSENFKKALQQRIQNKSFNFRGVWFPDELSLPLLDISSDADFSFATFNGVVDFRATKFMKVANFRSANFIEAAYFGFAHFGATDFRFATFNAAAEFHSATFTEPAEFAAVTFRAVADFVAAAFGAMANFDASTFSTIAGFGQVAFDETAKFSQVTFGEKADFTRATFISDVDFGRAIFGAEADFSRVTFNSNADFSYATFRDYASYTEARGAKESTNEIAFNFQSIRIEKPERFFFPAVKLRPHWLISVDPRNLDLAEVEWPDNLDGEIDRLEKVQVSSPRKSLAITYRRLAITAEENHHYEVASMFRHESMDMRRMEKWAGLRFWKTDWLYWIYWMTSGYGERISRALLWLVAICLVFSLLYTKLGFARPEKEVATQNDFITARRDEMGEPLRFPRSLLYSLEVMALQKPEPRPVTAAARGFVLLQMILGPVQAALLLLAVRRKFMR